ncbi:hypothetical protein ACA910_003720 [Epithemia clementina (nom. ined.)]
MLRSSAFPQFSVQNKKVKDTNLTVIQGDFENIDAIKTTVKDADYVICCAAGNLKGKPYKMIMGPFVERLWPILEANTSTKVFLYQAGMLSPKLGETLSFGMRTMKGIFGCLVGGLDPMIADNDSVIEFMASKKSTPFSVIVTRPGNLKEAESTGVPLKGSVSAPSMSQSKTSLFTARIPTLYPKVKKP